MKKILFIITFLMGGLALHAQSNKKAAYPDGKFTIYRLKLKDKKGSNYTLKHPEQFLSAQALLRRERQHLPIDSTDLPLSQKYIDKINKTGASVVGGSKWNNTVLVKVIDDNILPILKQMPFVMQTVKVFTAPDSCAIIHPNAVVKDTMAMKIKRTNHYGKGLSQIKMFNGIKLHEAGFQGNGMLIAIIDGGYMNVDKIGYFKDVNIIGTRDFVYPYTANLYDLLDHGTMVLSDMAANTDSLFVGTAPRASYLLLRSEDGRTENIVEEDYWAQAVEYADSIGADIINSSLGYTKFDDRLASHDYREQDGKTAINSCTASMIASKGMILVNSAGNEGVNTWKRINFPADATNILAVAALSSDSINAQFSSVGPSIDGRVKPDVAAQGVQSAVIDGTGIITAANGTSFASPITCGMVACLWQALPGKTAYQIMDLIRQSANRATYPDNIYGYGIPDFWKAYQNGLKNVE
ncbi:MAG: S8 family serine peptidase [Prevotella sp.]|nr:S8 family serine peptidase [Prevotella sp.]